MLSNLHKKTFRNLDSSDQEPPNDFTKMSIKPTFNDILSEQVPFLRKNIINGAYRDLQHYLDVHFRLLREDYMQPLRDGVLKFREIIQFAAMSVKSDRMNINADIEKQLKSIDGINTYLDTTCVGVELSVNSGIVYSVKLKGDKLASRLTKKLIYGSMVCMSSDYFATSCHVGIICDKDEENGIIGVKFDDDLIQHETYTMLETTAFFEVYRYVLEAFVSFRHDDEFPFKKYLVDCQNETIDKPKYLIGNDVYLDLRFESIVLELE